jgi:myo-inositol-1(or 4)-monophosphatase
MNNKITPALLEKVVSTVHACGKILLEQERAGNFTYFDKSDHSYATQADLASEAFLIEHLGKILPESRFLAEENGAQGEQSCEYEWVIDPIDGTTNFVQAIPYWSIAIALTYKDTPILGVVFNPATNEMFSALTGHGAFLNGKPIKVSPKEDFQRAVIALSVPSKKEEVLYTLTKNVQNAVHSVRKMGCASLDLAYVAAGRLDGATLKYIKWWDIAAGIVLVQEAQGAISEFHAPSINRDFDSCLASNGLLHKKLQKLLL